MIGVAGSRRSEKRGQRVRQHPGEHTRALLMRDGFDVTRVDPHASAVGTGLDLHAMKFLGDEIVSILGALHVMRLALGLERSRPSPFPLFPQQLSRFSDE